MAKQSITVVLDDETIGHLALLGKPVEVLAQLAYSATAKGARRHDQERRAQTDTSLKVERDKTDVAIAKELEAVEGVADDVVRVARQRADQVVQTEGDDTDSDHPPAVDGHRSELRARTPPRGRLSRGRSVPKQMRCSQASAWNGDTNRRDLWLANAKPRTRT